MNSQAATMLRFKAACAITLLAAFPARAEMAQKAAELAARSHPCAEGKAVSGALVPGGTSFLFQLKGDERKFRLAGLASDGALPISLKGPLRLYIVGIEPDRYGRYSADIFQGKTWLQGDLLANGAALADPTGRSRACAAKLLNAEPHDAALPAHKPDTIAAMAGKFTVIEGKVLSIGDREKVLYLNFGPKWSEDVTASAAKSGQNRFRGDIAALVALEGQKVRFRGTIELRGGPLIRLTDESQIERLDD